MGIDVRESSDHCASLADTTSTIGGKRDKREKYLRRVSNFEEAGPSIEDCRMSDRSHWQ